MRFLIVVLLSGGLAACSGLRGKAEDFFAQGAFREAVVTYEAAVQNDPGDEEAVVGLKRARTAFLDRQLIEVRLARMAGNQTLALDQLLEIVQLEAKWNYFPPGKLAITQEEESGEALRFVEGQVNEAVKSERPLRGLHFLRTYGEIFSGSLSGRKAYVERQLQQAGKKQCEGLSRNESADKPYFSEFVRKVCTSWSMEPKNKKTSVAAKNADLYGRIEIRASVAGMPQSLRGTLRSALMDSFERTPWFTAGGKKTLTLQLNGDFISFHQRTPEERVHGYTVQVPYTDYESDRKSRQVPYTDYREVCTYVGTQRNCRSVPETRYRTEFYTESKPVTRYRSVPRTQTYDGWNHQQQLELHAEAPLELGTMSRPLRVDAQVAHEGFEHHWNMPSIGLSPETPSLEDPKAWVENKARRMGMDLVTNAAEIWDALYCAPSNADPTLVATGDLVHRCLRLRHDNPPQFTNSWYERFFGITVAQADSLLKFEDL